MARGHLTRQAGRSPDSASGSTFTLADGSGQPRQSTRIVHPGGNWPDPMAPLPARVGAEIGASQRLVRSKAARRSPRSSRALILAASVPGGRPAMRATTSRSSSTGSRAEQTPGKAMDAFLKAAQTDLAKNQ